MREGRGAAGETGQATIEWTGLVLLVSLLLVGLLAAASGRLPATDLARAIAEKLVCALRLGNGPSSGGVWASDTGRLATAFVHVVDCRAAEPRGRDCSGGRAGNLYIQYWLFYEDSTSLRALPGRVGSHQDDWEGYQVRIGPGGTDARATSHHGYNYDGGLGSWLSDAGLVHRSAWGPSTGLLYVSGGSHAGHVHEDRRPGRPSRWTPADRLNLVPIETLDRAARRTGFAVVPPWRKPVYRDPEDQGT